MASNDQDPAARGFRTLLSAPSDAQRTPMQLSNLRPKNKSVRAACETCRKKKSKCTGERPQCQPCAARGTDCHYETIATETHSQARKRKFDDLQTQTSIYQELYNLLRTVSEEKSRDIFNKMRSGAEPESLVRLIKNGDLPIQLHVIPDSGTCYQFPYNMAMPSNLSSPANVYLKSRIFGASLPSVLPSLLPAPLDANPSPAVDSPIYLKPFHLARIVDERFENVNASRWTTVMSDNQLLANLLNAYFMHAYPPFPSFQKDLFLDDMVTGQTQFCSSLLVNAVLAHACHCYKPISSQSNHWTSQSLAYRFIVEAKRLWDIEDVAEPKITTIQAALVLNVIYNSNCTDRIGSTLLLRAVSMADELQILRYPSRAKSAKMAQSRQFTAWCLFIWQVMHGYYFFKAPLLDRPPAFSLPDPETAKDWYGEIWLKYPDSNGLARVNFPHVFKAWADLRVWINDISIELFREDHPRQQPQGRLPWAQVLMFRSALEEWYRNLPEPLWPDRIALPCQIRIHMEYYSTLYTLFQTQQSPDPSPPPPANVPAITNSALSVQSLCSPAPETEPRFGSIQYSTPTPRTFVGAAQSPRTLVSEPLMVSPAPLTTSASFPARRPPLSNSASTTSGHSTPVAAPLTLRLPTPSISSSRTSISVTAVSPFTHGHSPSYGHQNNISSPPYSLPHRYPSTPGSVGTPGSIPAYSVSPSVAPTPGPLPAMNTTGYNVQLPPVTNPGSVSTPRSSVSVSRHPSTASIASRATSVAGLSTNDAMAHILGCFETLVRLYYLRHSFEYYDSFLIYFLTMLGTSAIERAADARDMATVEAMRSTISLCIKGVYSQGKNFHLASVVARVQKNQVPAEDLGIILRHGDLPEVERDNQDIEADNIRAEWPIPIITVNADRRTSMIDTLVHTVQGFKLSADSD